ncbi:MAG: hypothetical protein GY937_05575 [bacterium]|nr:hypothetical protein [bacterium]
MAPHGRVVFTAAVQGVHQAARGGSPLGFRIVAILLTAIGISHALPARAQVSHPVFQKGFTFGGWSSEDYSRPEARSQIEELRAAGVEWLALTPRWVQAERSSQNIQPHPDLSPTDESLLEVIRMAQAQGLHVFLKPQVDVLGTGWRGEVSFSEDADWAKWFESYQAFISHYAALASKA